MTIQQSNSFASIKVEHDTSRIVCLGSWTIAHLTQLPIQLAKTTWPTGKQLTIDGNTISAFDTSGAWQLQKLLTQLQAKGITTNLQGFSPEQQTLLSLVAEQARQLTTNIPQPVHENWLERLGKLAVRQIQQLLVFLAFIGELAIVAMRVLRHPSRIHWRPLLNTIEVTGYQALPIIALLSFMIGVVLAYQMGLQLRAYGANIFIVDLLGLAILREFASLLTAIMVSGRTGSAFTAQLGTMKINEEIDALRTMGALPEELLILPKLIGLVIVLPLLTIWSDIFGIIGGMVMAKGMLGISFYDFLDRFRQEVSLSSLMIGLGKAPVFALLIASIGCFQGMQVRGSADSVGRQTTKSVVQAIFAIIVADALFSVIFSKLDI